MTARPRVDFVNFNFYDWDGVRRYEGGAERYVLDLARLVRSLGGVPRILQNARKAFTRVHDGIDVVGVPVAETMDFDQASRGFAELTRDAALVVASPEELACRLPASPPVVAINHGIHWDYENARLETFDAQRFRRLIDALRVCRVCVCVDTNFINWLRSIDTTAVPALRYVPNYVDLERFRPVPKRFDERLTFLFPRRLCFERGFRNLVTAFDDLLGRLPAIDLHICGTGGEEDEGIAAAFVARHPDRVRWSKLALDEMPDAFAASHVVLVPTVVAEGTSLSAIEGMATNNALVATFVGGLPNVVVDGLNGMLIRPGVAPLVAAVERLVEDRALVALLAQNGLGMCAAFSRERWEARWREVLAECVPAFADLALPVRVPNVAIAEYPQPSRDAYAVAPWRHLFETERPLLIADRDRQVALRELAEVRRVRAIEQRDEARAERERVRAARDALQAERDVLQADRDALQADRDALQAERDGLQAERDGLRIQRDALHAQSATLMAEQAAALVEAASASQAAEQARAARAFADGQLFWRNSELDGIKASTGWALLQQLYRVRFALFPRGSRREAAGKWAMHLARRVLRGGVNPALTELPAEGSPSSAPAVPRPSRDDRYTVVCFPSIEWGFRFQRPQQLARCLARMGHDVLFATHSFGAAFTSREVEPRVEEFELPGPSLNPYRDRMDEAQAAKMADALLAYLSERHTGRCVCLVQLPFWTPVAVAMRAAAGCDVIYDCMDLHAGFSSNAEAALGDEARLLGIADVVVCSSQQLLEHALPQAKRTALIRNGVDYEHFARVPDRERSAGGRMTVGYYGAIADWFDSGLVAAIARLRPQWRIVLVGSTWSADTAPLESVPNITLTGERPYTDLPALIEDWDCCIIPFRHTPLTAATNPVKVYEMLASGKPVVSVHLPELAPMAAAGLVELAAGASGFVEAIEDDALYRAQARERRRAFAADNTWALRTSALESAIDAIEPRVSIIIVTFNNRELNELCLASVLGDTDWPDLEVIVVDNASKDETPAFLRELASREPRVRLILNHDNRGFSAANNQGAAIARGRYFCFLNNDTVVHGAWLRTLVAHLRRNARAGLVGPVTNAIANEAKIPVGYEDLAGMPAWADAHCAAHRGELVDIAMLAFFCVALPRSVWQRIGPLDERFGTGMFEDDDYNRRVRAAGLDVLLARDSFVHHWQMASFKLLGDEEYLRIYRENQAKYASKWTVPGPAQHKLALLAQRGSSARGTVIFAPSVGWSIPLAQRPHHLARVLAREGYVVVFDCTNAGDPVDTLREVEPGLFLYNGPWEALCGLPRATLWLFSYNYEYRDAFPPGTPVVYDWIDDLKVFPFDQRKLETLHARAMREATVVIAVARRLHERALAERPDARYVPNAVEEGRFEREPEPNPALADPKFAGILAKGKPIAGYYGALARWFDYDLLRETARLRPDWSFVLIGPDHDGSLARSKLDRLPNVHALGPRQYLTLPGYLHRFDVATIPFAINDITLATSPLKLYEYFAAGKPVVSTPMPECTAFDDVRIVRGPDAFSAALDAARRDAADPAFRARLAALAARNTWRARARETMQALEAKRAGEGNTPVDLPGVLPPDVRSNAPAGGLSASTAPINGEVLPLEDSGCEDDADSPVAASIMQRFADLKTPRNRHFFRALAVHLAGSLDDPCLSMYFGFALSANDRGREAVGLIESIVPLAGKRALDVGCAYGGFLVALAERGAEPTGFDIDEALLALAEHNFRDVGRRYPVHRADVTLPADVAGFRNAFDVISCNDVIEHVTDPPVTVAHIASMLRPGGLAYFEIPNRDDVAAVMSDGHYQLFGITQLDREAACRYYEAHAPGVRYGVGHYLSLPEYRALFDAAGLSTELVHDPAALRTPEAIRGALAELREALPARLAQVPRVVRDDVERAVRRYIDEAERLPTNDERSFIERYGLSFWRIVARKPESATGERTQPDGAAGHAIPALTR
jgi:glycosyltransferase involved in cell wall biosynthesis/2-polyprenyl-3-methyl-5-hydroxy-6-metoxy-1,4-benzoquinol methylase